MLNSFGDVWIGRTYIHTSDWSGSCSEEGPLFGGSPPRPLSSRTRTDPLAARNIATRLRAWFSCISLANHRTLKTYCSYVNHTIRTYFEHAAPCLWHAAPFSEIILADFVVYPYCDFIWFPVLVFDALQWPYFLGQVAPCKKHAASFLKLVSILRDTSKLY